MKNRSAAYKSNKMLLPALFHQAYLNRQLNLVYEFASC